MLIPFETTPDKVAEFDPEYVKTATLKCLHGQQVNLRDVHVVYTHKVGETENENGYYCVCSPECYLYCVVAGNA